MYTISKKEVLLSSAFGLFCFILLSIGLEMKLQFFRLLDVLTFNWWTYHYGQPKMIFTGFFESYFSFFARFVDVPTIIFFTVLLAIGLMVKRYYALGIWTLYVVASGGLLGFFLKQVFHRPRPYDHLIADSGYSFPSGHTVSNSLFFMIVIILLIPKLKNRYVRCIAYTVTAVIWESVMFSRMYFHAHFFTDVIGGISFSLFWVMINLLLIDVFDRKVSRMFNGNKSIVSMK